MQIYLRSGEGWAQFHDHCCKPDGRAWEGAELCRTEAGGIYWGLSLTIGGGRGGREGSGEVLVGRGGGKRGMAGGGGEVGEWAIGGRGRGQERAMDGGIDRWGVG